MATEHRHYYLKTGLMGGWHPIDQKHPLDAGAHTHGDVEVRDAKLTRTSTVKARVSAEVESQLWADVEAATRAAETASAVDAAFLAGGFTRDDAPDDPYMDNAGFPADVASMIAANIMHAGKASK